MIRKRVKDVVIGLVVGSVLSTSLFGFAEMQSVQVFFNDIKIKINGSVVDTGTDKPFIYNGRTYIPTRFVAEGLGATVKWNETDNCVEVDSKNNQAVSIVTPVPTAIPQNTSYVFRKVNWGMSKDEVIKSEGTQPEFKDEMSLSYSTRIIELPTNVMYLFNQGRLCGIILNVNASHSNPNLYVDDYYSIKSSLKEKYGDPTLTTDEIWKDDLYKGDTEHYGIAIAGGRLKLISKWSYGDTDIYNVARGDNYKVELVVSYTSKTIELPKTDSGL